MSDIVLASEDNQEYYAIQKYPYRKIVRYNGPIIKNPSQYSPRNTTRSKHNEIENAKIVMDKASSILQHFASNAVYYNLSKEYEDDVFLYFKNDVNPNVGKLNFKIPNEDAYEDIINMLWDPNAPRNYSDNFVNGKILCTYDPNLVIIEHRYKDLTQSGQIYFHALFKKDQISEDTTILVMTSPNINDQHPYNNKYNNRIVEIANSFKTNIDSGKDIKKGKIEKMFVNLSGFIIKKEYKYVDITHIESIDFKCGYTHRINLQKVKTTKMLDVAKLKQKFDNE
ncbi:Acidic phosphoprotein precursor PCEMA1, putative [Plasmodium chabaudi adami]|uniref:Acidic phosphoprotein PCEMA1, putative n=1 Tax=Plasmodium chabaudi adami TaxID=5826 RepID=A0A1D3L837_PLACE|nr:Acidic phosphoprotein precursor PCEMA1, putative [Plasmodium chabaudi adami]